MTEFIVEFKLVDLLLFTIFNLLFVKIVDDLNGRPLNVLITLRKLVSESFNILLQMYAIKIFCILKWPSKSFEIFFINNFLPFLK